MVKINASDSITLRSAREQEDYTVEDVALVCDIAVEDIEKYEIDTRKLPFNLARRLRRLYHVKLEQIFIGLESEYAKNQALDRAQNVPKTCPCA